MLKLVNFGCLITLVCVGLIEQIKAQSVTITPTHVNCFGQATGSATANVTGGVSPFTYLWSNGTTTQTNNNLIAGTYTVTVTGANSATGTAQVTITQPPALNSVFLSITHNQCYGGSSGAIDLDVTGGVPPYTYIWAPSGSSQDLSGLAAGTYIVSVTDARGCQNILNAVITQPPVGTQININPNVTQISCFGQSNGAITTNVTGGTPGYAYLWRQGSTTLSTDIGISGLAAGTYNLTVTDTKFCTRTASFEIVMPSIITLSAVQKPVSCRGGSNGGATLTVTGGTSPYTYLWSNASTSQNLSGVDQNAYTVTVTDAKGCTRSTSVNVTEPATLLTVVTGTITNVTCNGGSNGGINATAGGGVTPYTYLWSNAMTSQNITGVAAGSYTVTVTDANGCTRSVAGNITQPATIVINTAIINVLCFGATTGSVTTSITNGVAPFSYLWSNSAITSNLSSVVAGAYTVTVTDVTGCSRTAAATVTQPAALLAVNLTPTNVTCKNGTNGAITSSVSGGTSPYSYLWNGGATTANRVNLSANTYTLTVTDANSCTRTASVTLTEPATTFTVNVSGSNVTCPNGTNGQGTATTSGGVPPIAYTWTGGGTTQTVTNLTAGTNAVTVTDANGCTSSATLTLTAPPAFNLNISKSDVNCFAQNTGSATASITGGTSPYTYNWSNGANTAGISNLIAITYNLTITDNSACTTTGTVTITQPAAGISATLTVTAVSCNSGSNGQITVVTSGGTPTYSYLWNGGSTSQNRTGLITGNYTVTITDSKGCTFTTSTTITQPTALALATARNNVSCNGEATGSISLTVTGGTPNYSFLWSNAQTTQNLSGLLAGNYTVTVTDNNNCTRTIATTLTEPTALSLTLLRKNVGCFNANDGRTFLTVSGGTPPYAYSWSNSSTSQNITGLSPNTYTVTVQDIRGCTRTASTSIVQPGGPLSATWVFTQPTCTNQNNGRIDLTVVGGWPPYTYAWSTGQTTEDINNGTPPLLYEVVITDTSGCTFSLPQAPDAPIQFTNPSGVLNTMTMTVVSIVHNECPGGSIGEITVNRMGGQSPFVYAWSNGTTNTNLENVRAGTYTVTVTDNNLCTTSISATITEPPAFVMVANVISKSCNGGPNDGSITMTITGGTPGYSYQWSNGPTTRDISGLAPGLYTLTITDSQSPIACTTFITTTVTQPPVLAGSAIGTNVSCRGLNNGRVDLAVVGGTTPYTFLWTNAVTSQNITNLAPGTYTVTVTDNKNCVITRAATITEPVAVLSSASTITDVLCNGASTGSVVLTPAGGTPNYTYAWGNGSSTISVLRDLTNVRAGTYTVTITDANSCTFVLTATITQPPVLAVSIVRIHVRCNGLNDGSIDLTPSGGVGGYSFDWAHITGSSNPQNLTALPASTYTVTITDLNGCMLTATAQITSPPAITANISKTDVTCSGGANGTASISVTGGTPGYTYFWSTGAVTNSVTNLAGGNYTVTVTDSATPLGCTYLNTFTITQPPAIAVSFNVTPVTCNGLNNGSITTSVSGGNGTYTYRWSTTATSANIINLTAGTYTLTVNDGQSCQFVESRAVTQPPALILAANATNVTCNGLTDGTITLNPTGGTPTYNFNWSSGASSQNLTGLAAGTYTATVTDFNLCTATVVRTITAPNVISVTPTAAQATCNGGTNGNISIAVTGGTGVYTYLWSQGSTTQNIAGLSAGTYTVTVTDANGCTRTALGIVTQPSALNSTITLNHITCNGANTGSIGNTVTGGTTPYNFSWSNGGNTAAINNLVAGTYTLTLTDANNCVIFRTGTITQPANPLTPSILATNLLCASNTNGTATLSVTGGTPPYNYLWSNSSTLQNLTGLSVNIYTVTVTDANNCTRSASVNITAPTPLILTTSVTNVSCFGFDNGAIDNALTGGVPPYTYTWSNTFSTQDLASLPPATYTLTYTDANGCANTQSYTITEPSVLAATTSVTNVTCFGQSNGSITLAVSGGTPPYSFLWSNATNLQNPTNLSAGTYVVTVTDARSCTALANATITQPASSLTSGLTVTNVRCFGGSNGGVVVSVSGGISPYSFAWSSSETSNSIINKPIGSYTVTVSDANSCTQILMAVITQPAVLVNTLVPTHLTCNGSNNGAVATNVSGGTAPYTFSWSNGQTTQNLGGLPAGNLNVTITDVNGCTTNGTVTITQPSGMTVTSSQIDIACNGGSNGAITLNVSGGGGAPFTYLWSNGFTTQNLTDRPAGTYTVTITDATACTRTFMVTLTEPAILTLALSKIDAVCSAPNSGSISSTVGGGTPPFTYSWQSGQSTPNLTGLNPGTFTLTVTDSRACQAVRSVTLLSISPLTLTLTGVDLRCANAGNGIGIASITGGLTPYTFLWSDGGLTQNRTNLLAKNYTLTVTDNSGCTTSASLTLTQPPVLASSILATPPSCNGGNNGSINLTVSGGVSPYLYNWSNGATTSVLVNLSAGTYTVTITDGNTCTRVQSAIVNQPQLLDAVLFGVNVTCSGSNSGSILLSVTGGTPNYTYLWSNGATTPSIFNLTAGTYGVVVTDAQGCNILRNTTITQPSTSITIGSTVTYSGCTGGNSGVITLAVSGGTSPYNYVWNNGQGTSTITGLAPGTYTVTVTDAASCTRSLAVNVTPQVLLTANLSGTNLTCFANNSGSISVSASGGVSPYNYMWSNGGVAPTITGLAAGNYTVTVTDLSGCTVTRSTTLTQPSNLGLTVTRTNITCFGYTNGAISVTVNGGSTPYNYSWSTGASTPSINNLPAGTYQLTVTDNNGCTTTNVVILTQPASLLTVGTVGTNVSCSTGSNGSVVANVTGGVMPYSYVWSNGSVTQNINGLVAGSYTVTVQDAAGCSFTASSTITEPASINPSISATAVSCFGGSNGRLVLTFTPISNPYTQVWSNGATTLTVTNLTAGTYNVTITDGLGCTRMMSSTVSQPNPLTLSISRTNVLCQAAGNGTALATPNGGTAPYAYLWSNSQVSASISGLVPGTYTVTVTDANGCSITNSTSISEPTRLIISSPTVNPVLCFGQATGAVSITASGGTPAYTYLWNNGSSTSTLSDLNAGSYTVTVTDANGCTSIASATVNQPASAITVEATSTITNVQCTGGSNGAINAVVSGGTPGYSYLWSNGQTTASITGLAASTYTLTATDANACTATRAFTVTQPINRPAPSLAVTVTQTTCVGASDGRISATSPPNGGILQYSIDGVNFQLSGVFLGLRAGSYTVIVRDELGCQTSATATINDPADPIITSITNITTSSAQITWTAVPGVTTYNLSYRVFGAVNWTQVNNIAGTNTILNGLQNNTNYEIRVQHTLCSNNPRWSSITNFTTLILAGACATTGGLYANPIPGQDDAVNIYWNTDANAAGWTLNYRLNGSLVWIQLNCVNPPVTLTGLQPNATYQMRIRKNCVSCPALGMNLAAFSPIITFKTTGTCPTTFTLNGGITNEAACNAVLLEIDQNIASFYGFRWFRNGQAIAGATGSTYLATVTGTYSVSVTAGSTCAGVLSAPIGVTIYPNPPVATISTTTPISCASGSLGSLTANVSGGTSPLFYLWSTGSQQNTITNLTAGTYSVTVTDGNGCTTQVSRALAAPNPLIISTSSVNANCQGMGGSATAVVTGGTPPYTYAWNTSPTQLSQTAINLQSGNFIVTVTDAGGCSNTAVADVRLNSDLTANLSVINNVGCNGAATGALNIVLSGGVAPIITQWSTGATSTTITNLSAGTYTATVTDGAGCLRVLTAVLNNAPALVLGINTATNTLCSGVNNGSATVAVSSGNAPYAYQWSNGQTTATATGLSAGNHTVTVTDANGCSRSLTVNINTTIALNATSTVVNTGCTGINSGSITVSMLNGATPFTFNWSVSSFTSGVNATTALGLAAGSYTLTVIDANGCRYVTTQTVQGVAGIATIATTTRPTCFGNANGTIVITASNGVPPYLFTWSNGASQLGNSSIQNGLIAGNYTITVTDANNCFRAVDVVLSQPNSLTVTVSTSNIGCGAFFGSATANVSGGTAPYFYQWSTSPVQNATSITGLVPGTYTVTVTDANNCTATGIGTVSSSAVQLTVTTSGTPPSSCSNNGTASAFATGGTQPYTYRWSTTPQQTTSTAFNLNQGTYTVTVTDASGCFGTGSVTIVRNTGLSVTVNAIYEVSCNNRADGALAALAIGGNNPYTYQWSNGQTTSAIGNLAGNIYTVTVTDASGCSVTASRTLTNPVPLGLTLVSTQPDNCGGTGSATVQAAGGAAPYSYTWNTGSGNATNTGLNAGTYTVTVTDSRNCTATLSFTITNASNAIIVAEATPISCPGADNGKIIATGITNGTPPFPLYTYSIDGINYNTNGVFTNLAAGIYIVRMRDPSTGCISTTNVTIPQNPAVEITGISSISVNSATVTWSGNESATYSLQYRVQGANLWQTISISGTNTRNLTALQNNTTYEVRIATLCSGGIQSPYSTIQRFTTQTQTATCRIPGGIYVNINNATTATVSWNAVSGASCYVVSYGVSGTSSSTWPNILVNGATTSTVLENLQPNTNYTLRIRANCTTCSNTTGIFSLFSPLITFNTAITGNKLSPVVSASTAVFAIYPNPTHGQCSIRYEGNPETITELQLFDLSGKIIYTERLPETSGQYEHQFQLPASVSKGVYIVALTQGDKRQVSKLVVH